MIPVNIIECHVNLVNYIIGNAKYINTNIREGVEKDILAKKVVIKSIELGYLMFIHISSPTGVCPYCCRRKLWMKCWRRVKIPSVASRNFGTTQLPDFLFPQPAIIIGLDSRMT
jgi:hypothetical protein